jgi:hypothetical protein
MTSTATQLQQQHCKATCPFLAVFYTCPPDMSIAWTYHTPSVHFLSDFGQVQRERHGVSVRNLRISPLKPQETTNKSRNPAITPVPMPLRGRYYSHSKPGGPLSQDMHTSSGLSIYGLGVGT